MHYQLKYILSLTASLLILLSTCISQNNTPRSARGRNASARGANTIVTDLKVVFPMNEYLTTSNATPYPVLIQEKFQNINTGSFVNVMNYGAAGNGTTADDEAIAKAFAACKDGSGVLFPKEKKFLIKNLIRVPLDKNITIYAYGATFKMAANTGYNTIAFEGNDNGYNNQIIWLGGTFDGNKNQQAWPGSPTGNNNWTVTQNNYGLLTIRRAKFALVKDISLENTVYDGVDLFECELGVIADSKAENGVPLQYDKVEDDFEKGRQATYFKVTRQGSQTAYFTNLDCKGGSIGVHFSSKPVNENSLAVVTNCRFSNQAQDAIHFEHCKKVFIDKVTVYADNYSFYHNRVHISNNTEVAAVTNSSFTNGKVDFRNAAMLNVGVVQNCKFLSTGQSDSTVVKNFVQNAIHVLNCTFDGRTQEEQVQARLVDRCTFKNFKIGLTGAMLANKCTFSDGNIAVQNSKAADAVSECTFTNVRDKSQGMSAAIARSNNNNAKSLLLLNIEAVDQNGKRLGKIAQ